ncbi:Fc.00g023940.m01.CDS01 [Cosmosporella sp. VM-42]
MYARYVPPAKGGQATNVPSSASSQGITSAPAPAPAAQANAPPADGFSYSRYIPGSKPAPKPVEPSKVYFDDAPSPPTPKRKRDTEEAESESKKSKKLKNRDEAKPVEAVVAPKAAQGKKKRSRRSKRRTAASDSDSDSEEDKDNAVAQAEPEPPKVEALPAVDEEETKSKKSKKEKKDKKEKKEKKMKAIEPAFEEPETEPEAEDVSMADVEGPVETKEDSPEPMDTGIDETEREKKTRDKKKKRKGPEPTEEKEEEDAEKRHKAVLERKTKSLKISSETVQDNVDEEDLGELHGLEPLPQPEPANINTSKPTYETLPPWLAEPIRVSQDTRTPFTDLGLIPKASRVLEEKGYKDAFAVQTAAIPLLLPTSKHRPGDVLISAATGSGKTLAYALPIVRDISQGVVTRLRVLVVLPTRELVKQAQDVFELCAKAYEGGDRKRVRIGVSVGSQSLKSEQETLMDKEIRYDPEAYKQLQEESRLRSIGLADTDSEAADPRLSTMEGHVVDFYSKVDVLLCTPGRLVEHIEQTPGFSLDYVRWLVVDEADKLLAQSFQGWLELAMEKFKINKFSARDFPDMDLSGVRKVILSATLTRDLSLLSQLALRRPRLIVLESDKNAQIAEHSLPALLKEYAIRVHDTNLKPLYLLELLQGQHMLAATPLVESTPVAKPQESDGAESSSDSSSDADSDATSNSSSDSSASDSDTEPATPTPARSRKLNIPVSLIFTKSNESALRLSRLLTLLDPSLGPHIGTLTSTTPTHIRRKTLRAFTTPSSPIRLLIASDLVARGIDLSNLDHVINYDLPPSVAGYVHRVGRTARAGRSGSAWTLVGDDESGWFWGKIAKGAGVRRAQKVERTRIEEMGEGQVQEYELALEKLGKEAGR